MQGTHFFFILSLLAAFVAGAISHAVFQKPISEKQATPPPAVAQTGPSAATPSTPPHPATRHDPALPRTPAPAEGSLVLRTEVVDAILAGGGARKLFQRLGLTEEDRAEVTRIGRERMAAFKQLEASHAKVVADPQGSSHVEIAPFPNERGEWLKGMEEDLRKQLDDDRASVVARVIAFDDNDEDIGMFRREIFVTPPEAAGGKIKIEEKTFDSNGSHVDSDYELIDDRSKSRWGHLLDFETAN
ncbi:MAG: hypothetical protein EOP88_08820 [Verrucomicrobiaceae bacterium]|nr:MAG: hypothetical protein EOP88_08820 [Verrucomicrobiaceae bacterium]